MKDNNNVSFISDNVRKCFLEIFENAFYRCGKKYYNISLQSVINYLTDPKSASYDTILKKYPCVNKKFINQMLYAKFMEINYFRIKNNIIIDNVRANMLKEATDVFVSVINRCDDKNRLHLDINRTSIVVNDAYLHLLHSSNLYSTNVIKDIRDDCFDEIVSIFYPLIKLDHVEKLVESTTEKEVVYGNLFTETINSIEREQFRKNKYPIPDLYYCERCKKILEESNLYDDIISNFDKKIIYNTNNIIYIMEMAKSILDLKNNYINELDIKMSLSDDEKLLLKQLNMIVDDKDKNIVLFNNRKNSILKILIDNILNFDKDKFLDYRFNFNNGSIK